MKRHTATLSAVPLLAATLLLAGCASSSSSDTSGATGSGAAQPSASDTWTGTSEHPGSPAPASSAPAPSSSAPGSSTSASPRVPASATSAVLTYLGPRAAKPVRTEKTVTGLRFEKLATLLNALRPQPAGTAECMVLTGENATVTITAEGHTWVFTVDGSPCRPVRLTEDGVDQPKLVNTTALLREIRSLAGFTGMAHPQTG